MENIKFAIADNIVTHLANYDTFTSCCFNKENKMYENAPLLDRSIGASLTIVFQ